MVVFAIKAPILKNYFLEREGIKSENGRVGADR
jgi:hypothetical protein